MSLNLEVQILGEYKNLTKATKGATKQLNSLKKSAQGISRGINTALATIGVGISFKAITSGISSLTKAAVDDIKAQTLLAQQLRNTIGASDDVVASVEEQISAVQTATGVVDDELRPAYAKLIRSTKDTSRAFRLLNLATDISAQTGKSLDSVSQALSRALNGNTASLVKLVPSIRNSTDFVADLEKQFKGAAEAANNLDPYNRLQIAFDNVRETIGAAFLPALGSIATFINENLPTIQSLADAINNKVKAAFEGAGTSAENFGNKVINAITDLTDFLNGTADADNGFAKFADGIKPVIELFSAFGEIAKGIIAVFDGLAVGLFGWLNIFLPAGEQVNGLASLLSGFGKILQQVGGFIGYVASFFIPFSVGLKAASSGFIAITKGGKGFNLVIKDLLEGIGNFLNSLQRIVGGTGTFGEKVSAVFTVIRSAIGGGNEAVKEGKKQIDEFNKKLDAQDGKRIRNFIDVITTQKTDMGLIPASPTNEAGRPPLPLRKPGYSESFIGRDDQWYTRTWTGTGWKITKDADAYKTPSGGSGDTTFQTRVKAVVAKLQETLDEAKARIKNASESFRDAVGLSFGVITNGFSARFSTSKVIAQMKRIKDAVKTFSKDIIELRKKGADAALIDELIGLGPLAGSAAARDLLTSGSLNEFLGLRKDLASSGAAVGAAGNIAINGTSTSGLQNAINGLNRTIAAGKGNTYNISIANPNITPQQIIAEIKAYEKKTGKKVFSN